MSDDKDLNELLDLALKDFDAPKDKSKSENKNNATDTTKDKEDENVATAAVAEDTDDFFIEQAKVLADRMNTLFGGPNTPTGDIAPLPQDPDQILAGFHKMAEAAAMTLEGSNPSTDEEVAKYSGSIAQALKGLQEGSDQLEAPISESDIASMFNSINLDPTSDSESNSFLPFMEGMMQSLLSAEILLPSIKELLEKYPKYLAENGANIAAEDKERYEKQYELYKIIEEHLETENSNDTPATKRNKFKIILEDMRKLQEYGQPPEEILNESANDLPPIFDPSTLAAGQNPQCPMM